MSEATFEKQQGMLDSELGVGTDKVRPESRLVEDLNMNDLDLAEAMQDIESTFALVISD